MAPKIVIVRHGERVDLTFGSDWITTCFDSEGNYQKLNLNMPDSIEKKAGMPLSYRGDTPLTQVGHLQGYLVGKGLAEQNVLRPGFITFVSPALRSIQTCTEALKGMQEIFNKNSYSTPNSDSNSNLEKSSTILKVEPALFEWNGFYKEGTPSWLTLEELKEAGYTVDPEYTPFINVAQLQARESSEDYYTRSYDFMRHVIDKYCTVTDDKDILLVCHGITLDAATCQLFGQPPRSLKEMFRAITAEDVPFAGFGILSEEVKGDDGEKEWKFQDPGRVVLKHGAVNDFRANHRFPEL